MQREHEDAWLSKLRKVLRKEQRGEPKDGVIREHASKQDGYHRFGLTANAAGEDGNEPDTLRIDTGGLQDARAEYL